MSELKPPPDALVDRAFATGEHIGEPWCGTAYCPVCLTGLADEIALDTDAAEQGHDHPKTDAITASDIRRAGSMQAQTFLSSAALALRAIQRYDEVAGNSPPDLLHRYLLIEAETALGELLGLTCTGEPSMWSLDDPSKVTGYDHNGDTCPIHEWLVESDQKEVSG